MPDCMRELDARDLRSAVIEAAKNKPFLGICIGQQMLFEHSEEGDVLGLGVFAGRVRRSDTVARTGGDEFSLILEDPTSREDAQRVGQSLMQLLNDPLNLGDQMVQVGASVGISLFPEDALDMESLCIAADRRMYDNKERTRGRTDDIAKPLADTSETREKQPGSDLEIAQ